MFYGKKEETRSAVNELFLVCNHCTRFDSFDRQRAAPHVTVRFLLSHMYYETITSHYNNSAPKIITSAQSRPIFF